MFVQYEDFLVNVIQKALPCHPYENQQNQKFYKSNSRGSTIYFRRVFLPDLEYPEDQKLSVVRRMTNQLQQELLLTQAKISKYILRYEKIIFSYPYACFVHYPYETTVKQLIQKKSLKYSQKIRLALELSKAVKSLNDKEIYIRCLSPSSIGTNRLKNDTMFEILLTQPSSFLWVGRKYMNKKIQYNNGYVAPEILQYQEVQSKYSCDIWSIGIIIYELLFQKVDSSKPIQKGSELTFPKWTPQWLSNFILGTLNENPKQRFSINDVVKTLEKAYLCSDIQQRALKTELQNKTKIKK